MCTDKDPPACEQDDLIAQVDRLQDRNARLTEANKELRKQLATAQRAGKRQAAPLEHSPVAIITGLSRRAGLAAMVSFEMRRAGWRVGLTGWPRYDSKMPWGDDPFDRVSILEELEAISSGGAIFVEADLSDVGAPQVIFDQVEEELGNVDALINVHTHSMPGGLLETSAAEFDRHMVVNARGTFLMTAEYARRWHGVPGSGRVVNFTSSLPLTGEIAYAASKGATEWLTVAAASELAGRGITVNAVNPGPNNTGWMSQELKHRVASMSPLGQLGTPMDVAKLIVFLCSPAGGWITGQILNCDGGWDRLRG